MTALVTGDRAWPVAGHDVIRRRLDALSPGDTVIHGGARGVDQFAGWYAAARGLRVTVIPAEWDRFGSAAGPIRNRLMLAEKPDVVLAFHDDLRRSLGTRDCVAEAQRRGVPVEVWTSRGERATGALPCCWSCWGSSSFSRAAKSSAPCRPGKPGGKPNA
jgi:YspA, cpYpsA-related SLOG family